MGTASKRGRPLLPPSRPCAGCTDGHGDRQGFTAVGWLSRLALDHSHVVKCQADHGLSVANRRRSGQPGHPRNSSDGHRSATRRDPAHIELASTLLGSWPGARALSIDLASGHQRGRDGGNAEKSCGFAPTITTPWCCPFPQVRLRLARAHRRFNCLFSSFAPLAHTHHPQREEAPSAPWSATVAFRRTTPAHPSTTNEPAPQRPTHTHTRTHRQSPVELSSTPPTPYTPSTSRIESRQPTDSNLGSSPAHHAFLLLHPVRQPRYLATPPQTSPFCVTPLACRVADAPAHTLFEREKRARPSKPPVDEDVAHEPLSCGRRRRRRRVDGLGGKELLSFAYGHALHGP